MLIPKRTKYRKQFRGRMKGRAHRGNTVTYGEYWVAVVKPGRVMFEMGGIPAEAAKEAMRLASNKLPIKTKFVVKGQEVAGE